MNKQNNDTLSSTLANASKLGYESKVLAEALERAGNNPNIKGIIHEVMVKDLFNGNPVRLLDGKTAQLVNSNTANAVDMVVMKGGKVLERIQLKDTPKSIATTVRKVADGQYRSVQLWGTTETTEAFNQAAKTSKTMSSTGISSETTEALAKRVGQEGANGSVSLGSSVKTMAKSGAMWGGAISAATSAFSAFDDYFEGEKDEVDVITHIAKETAGGAFSGAAAGAAATATGAALAASVGTATTLATAVTVGAPVCIAVGIGYVAKSLWDSIFD